MSIKKQKKSRRSQTKYPGLEKTVNRRVIREYMDQDYIDKLSPDEKQWLSNFNDEWLTGNFKHKDGKVLHKSWKHEKEIYDRNNARNRDLVSILKQSGAVNNSPNLAKLVDEGQKIEQNTTEDTLIKILDFKNKVKRS